MPHRRQRPVISSGSGGLPGAPAFLGAVALPPRGAEVGYAARRRRGPRGRAACGGLWDHLQVGVCVRVLWGRVPVAASESQRPDDLLCRVQRRRSGARFALGRGLCHCCVVQPESRGWCADLLWLSGACSDAFRWGAWPRDAAVTCTSKQASKALRSQGHQDARVM